MSTIDKNEKNQDSGRLKLENQLCFALYVTSKEIIKKYKPLLEPLGLTYTSYITMMALWEEDHINVKDLGKKLYLDSGTLTPLLKKLEAKGWLERRRSASDERHVHIHLTEKGQLLKNQAMDVPNGLLCSLDLGDVDGHSLLKTLRDLMPKLV